MELGELTDDALTGEYRIWQRKKGHRYSLDDVLTAWVGLHQVAPLFTAPKVSRYLDLGCGIGSVLLMVASKFQDIPCFGIEAQEISFELVTRNIERNGQSERIRVTQGDLRDDTKWPDGRFELITCTPPYKPPGTATPAPDSQKAYARIEYRGGAEAYLKTASSLISDDGLIAIVVEEAVNPRVEAAAKDNNLHLFSKLDVIPREGQPSLFSVWTLGKTQREFKSSQFIARDKDGNRTDAYFEVREFFGLKRQY